LDRVLAPISTVFSGGILENFPIFPLLREVGVGLLPHQGRKEGRKEEANSLSFRLVATSTRAPRAS
jgi:hypothetical protein